VSAENFPHEARRLVYKHVKSRLEPTDDQSKFTIEEVYVVSYHYVVGSWKAFVSTTLPDGMYYEVTYKQAAGETYITSYKQWEHTVLPDERVS
jgi:hypothetical protein